MIKTEKENIEIATKLIKNNLQLPLSFHIHNIFNNKLIISRIKIKNIPQRQRKEYYPKDDEFLDNIELIKLDFGDTEESKNLFFCPVKEAFINPKTKKLERIILFSTLFQINLFSECKELFIDGTFKMVPQKYYQILNFLGFLSQKKYMYR